MRKTLKYNFHVLNVLKSFAFRLNENDSEMVENVPNLFLSKLAG